MTKPRTARAHYERRHDDRVYREVSDMFNSRRKSTTDTPAAAAHSPATAAGAPLSLEEQREALILAMEGPHALALDAVRDDSGLRDRLSDAVDQGMSVIDLSGVPRYRRAAAVETALDEWDRGTLGGPCQICGCLQARRGFNVHRSIDGIPPTPGFQNGKCDFCREALRTMPEDRLLRHVFSAKVGLRNFDGRLGPVYRDGEWYGRFVPTFAELREHLPSIRPGEPWGYVPQAFLEGVLKAQDFPRHCFVTTRRDQLLHSFDNITAPIHDDSTLPAVKQRVPVFVEPTEREKRLEREWQEFQERSAKFRAAFKAEQERPNDYVDPHGGLPKTFHYLSASAPGSPVTGGILVPLGK